jgi:hypothetical protein
VEIVNEICHPEDEAGRGNHKHQCKACGTAWKHSDKCADGTLDEFDRAHSCPSCGTEETKKLLVTEADKDAVVDAFLRRVFGE